MKLNSKFFILFFSFISTNLFAQEKKFSALDRPKNLSDTALLELVQKQTFKYFWDFAHPTSNLSRERSNIAYDYGDEVVTIGGTGFGVMSVIVATERKWITRDTAAKFLLKMVNFLSKTDRFHGVFPHWMHGSTGKTIPFSKQDDGADLVETSYLMQGLLCARQYFNNDTKTETDLHNQINILWNNVEWDWFTRGGKNVLYWHWSPKNKWAMNFPIHGFNECMITYILAECATKHAVPVTVYSKGWAQGSFFKNGKTFFGHRLPLGFDYGGPLFFSHYTFLGLNPTNLKDQFADYWQQNKNHTLINHDYCVANPKKFIGYSENCWGLTASDTYNGYNAYSPTNDEGTISPTASLSAFPYTPEYSMKALKHFYYDLGDSLWSQYGFVDAFNETQHWFAKSHLAIDQGPIIVMIENYRTGLMWKLFMSCAEIKNGLKKLSFQNY